MKQMNWDAVEEKVYTGGGHDVPTGLYTLKVLKVLDEEDFVNKKGMANPRLGIVWDVAEGEHADTFADEWGADEKHDFIHTRWHYYDSAPGIFKGFYRALEESNPGYRFDGTPGAMVGKVFGAAVNHRYRRYNGKVMTDIDIAYTFDAAKIAEQNEPRDKYEDGVTPADVAANANGSQPAQPAQQTSAAAYDPAEIPF